MPKIYKVRDEDHEGNVTLYHSSADIVGFDATNTLGMTAENAQQAIEALYQKAEDKASIRTLTTIIRASAFTGNTTPYVQRILVPEILETDNPDVSVNMSNVPADALAQRESFGSVSRINTENGAIVVYCYEDKPRVDVPIKIRVFR